MHFIGFERLNFLFCDDLSVSGFYLLLFLDSKCPVFVSLVFFYTQKFFTAVNNCAFRIYM
jgi:hypothetical protein